MSTSSAANQRQLDLLLHTLGLQPERRDSTRNYFLASEGHHDYADLESLASVGLMVKQPAPEWCGGGEIYRATEAGKSMAVTHLPPAPKLSRYREYLRSDVGDSFADYLGIQLPDVEYKSDGEKTLYRYVRIRRMRDFTYERIEGQWAPTKKAAKASYKEMLKTSHQQ